MLQFFSLISDSLGSVCVWYRRKKRRKLRGREDWSLPYLYILVNPIQIRRRPGGGRFYPTQKLVPTNIFLHFGGPWRFSQGPGCNTLTRIDMNWHSTDSFLLAMQCVEVTVALTVHCPRYGQSQSE